jgi:hypothetical protein
MHASRPILVISGVAGLWLGFVLLVFRALGIHLA